MAWYALWKYFKSWRPIRYVDWNTVQKDHQYDLWFQSLSPEEQAEERKRKKKERQDIYDVLLNFLSTGMLLKSMSPMSYEYWD